MLSLAIGATSTSLDVQFVDDAGLPVTGLVAATMPSLKYSKGTGADVTITPVDLATLADAFESGGVLERDGGYYRLDVPDGVASTAAIVRIRGEATGKRLICPPLQIGLEDALVAALSSFEVAVVSPISNRDGRLTIAAGDDYTDESGNSFNITITGTLPSLSGATFALTLRPKDYPDATPIVGTATLTSQVGATAVIKCEISRTQTALGRDYASTNWWYDLQTTLADGTVRTLKGPQAPCTVLLDQTQ